MNFGAVLQLTITEKKGARYHSILRCEDFLINSLRGRYHINLKLLIDYFLNLNPINTF